MTAPPFGHGAAAMAVSILLLAGCGPLDGSGASHTAGPGVSTSGSAPYAEVLAATQARVQSLPDTSPDYVLAQLDLARLSGDFRHYVELARAIATTSLPCDVTARAQFALHRFSTAGELAARCLTEGRHSPAISAELAGIRGDADFQAGHYLRALASFRESVQRAETPAGYARLSRYYAATGAPAEALALLDRAEALDLVADPYLRAWLSLQRSELARDHGRLDVALAQALRAERFMPGWWLSAEHLAALRAWRGETDLAFKQFLALATQTDNPEHYDALARLAAGLGRHEDSTRWFALARRQHRERLAQLPELARGHAVEHFLMADASDAEALLQLATENVSLRPGAPARLLLAEARLRRGEAAAALAALRPVLQSPWTTAELHVVAARVYAANGDADAALRSRQQALMLNPSAFEMYAVPGPPPDVLATVRNAP